MFKKVLLLTFFLSSFCLIYAQENVGIGTNAPDPSASLDIVSTNKGVLLTRINDTLNISNPATGLLIYHTPDSTFRYFDGIIWRKIFASGISEINNLGFDTDVDSANLVGFTLTIYEDGSTAIVDLQAIADSAILTIYNNIADTLLNNQSFIDSIVAQIGNMDDDIDSANLSGYTLAIYESGSIATVNLQSIADSAISQVYQNISDTLLSNSYFMDSLTNLFSGGSDSLAWKVIGNSGTNPSSHFLGTTDNDTMTIKLNNIERFRLNKYSLEFINTRKSVSIGEFAGVGMHAGSSDRFNVFIGYQAGKSNTSGYSNTAIGYNALMNAGISESNTAIGYRALENLTSVGAFNTAVGSAALINTSNGQRNVAIGQNALLTNTTGNYNIALGTGADSYNQTGNNNTIIGFEAGRGSTIHSKSGNVFLGYQAGYSETGSNKLYIENSNANDPLIYGEFDNNIVRVNGALQVNDPATTGYVFPLMDGLSAQMMYTDGNGQLAWDSIQNIPGFVNGVLANEKNFAEDNLTANGNRTHDFEDFSLIINDASSITLETRNAITKTAYSHLRLSTFASIPVRMFHQNPNDNTQRSIINLDYDGTCFIDPGTNPAVTMRYGTTNWTSAKIGSVLQKTSESNNLYTNYTLPINSGNINQYLRLVTNDSLEWADPSASAGSYTPVITGTGTDTILEVHKFKYSKVDSIVNFSGKFKVAWTNWGGVSSFYITLPISSDFTNQEEDVFASLNVYLSDVYVISLTPNGTRWVRADTVGDRIMITTEGMEASPPGSIPRRRFYITVTGQYVIK